MAHHRLHPADLGQGQAWRRQARDDQQSCEQRAPHQILPAPGFLIPQLREHSQPAGAHLARLPAESAAVRRALEHARGFCEAREVSRDAAERLAIIVEEWIANVLEHGETPARSRIILSLAHQGEVVRVTFSDAGLPFDPREASFEGPHAERGGGAGLELIRAWSRIVVYARRGGRNRVVLDMPL
ncbi:MAG: ATP-binding protein [Pseudomonadota bacterium]